MRGKAVDSQALNAKPCENRKKNRAREEVTKEPPSYLLSHRACENAGESITELVLWGHKEEVLWGGATMTTLLQEAFQKASVLPDSLQDQLAKDLIEEIESESRWDNAFVQSQDPLHRLGEKALSDMAAGRGKRMGFDEL